MNQHRPNILNAYDLIRNADQWRMNEVRLMGKGTVPARPISAPSLAARIKIAWRVFTGRYDALVWPGQEQQQ